MVEYGCVAMYAGALVLHDLIHVRATADGRTQQGLLVPFVFWEKI